MIWALLGTLIPKVFSGVSNYVNKKQEHEQQIQLAKTKAKIAEIQHRSKMIADADVASIQEQRHSIKDEVVIFCIFAPYVAAFIPGFQQYILEGFQILSTLPHWYQISLIGIVVSVMGLRFMLGKFFKK